MNYDESVVLEYFQKLSSMCPSNISFLFQDKLQRKFHKVCKNEEDKKNKFSKFLKSNNNRHFCCLCHNCLIPGNKCEFLLKINEKYFKLILSNPSLRKSKSFNFSPSSTPLHIPNSSPFSSFPINNNPTLTLDSPFSMYTPLSSSSHFSDLTNSNDINVSDPTSVLPLSSLWLPTLTSSSSSPSTLFPNDNNNSN
jgi:RNase P subunit RPR2